MLKNNPPLTTGLYYITHSFKAPDNLDPLALILRGRVGTGLEGLAPRAPTYGPPPWNKKIVKICRHRNSKKFTQHFIFLYKIFIQ
jgi:hypothetical protein